ncbi:MAG: RebB family R body protein [Deltaproteobacteria bacterium]|nr:RebB family R body protein [Deltaproteobacteria bacterium]
MSSTHPTLDPQVADALTTINAMVVGASPSMASGVASVTLGYAQSLAAYNAVFAQQQAYITAQTAAVADVLAILRP